VHGARDAGTRDELRGFRSTDDAVALEEALMHVRALVMAAALAVLAAAGDVAAQNLTPHVLGWERYFAVSWEAFDRGGRPYLGGHVANLYGAPAWRVQLLVDSLDASGQIVAQRVEWLGGDVGTFSRRYFEVPTPGPASSYRVRVFAFDFLQAALLEAP
jgi:hypothetical protein